MVGTANQITFARAVLTAGLAGLVLRSPTSATAWNVVIVAGVAALLDGVDGWQARRTGTTSAFGARFDMETDAALILVLSMLVWRYGKAGLWVLLSGLLRYAFIASGSIWPWMKGNLAPTYRAKIVCIVQITALIIAMAPTVARPASSVVAAVALIALCYSFLADTIRLWRRTQ